MGGGGHCRSVIDVIESLGLFEIVGVMEHPNCDSYSVNGYPVLGEDQQLSNFLDDATMVLVTVGQIKKSSVRKALFDWVKSIGA